MSKYSIIIPTLWKSERTNKLLADLISCEFVDEIILIDNTMKEVYDRTINKIRKISFGKNIYVNPAWNKGIELAKNECIALCNDDINFNPKLFQIITENVLTHRGIIGMSHENYSYRGEEVIPILKRWKPGMSELGWGCLLLLKKSSWIPIPDEIKIWYGDNYIQDVNPVKKSILENFKIETEMSTTSGEEQWDETKKQDQINYLKYLNK